MRILLEASESINAPTILMNLVNFVTVMLRMLQSTINLLQTVFITITCKCIQIRDGDY